MSELFIKHVALDISPRDIETAKQFYQAFGLQVNTQKDGFIDLYCDNVGYPSMRLRTTGEHKKFHHVQFGTSEQGLAAIKQRALAFDVNSVVDAPEGFANDDALEKSIWLKSPTGIFYNVIVATDDYKEAPVSPFLINSPGNLNRANRGALPAKSTLPPVRPLRLGHVLLFTPDVDTSLTFVEQVLGMRLSDRSGQGIAFIHCPGGSEHHVIAFAKSSAIGFHHASFLVGTPDEVGIGGDRLYQQGYTKAWGFGRHAIGSNFFHYVADPWGSYLEYYCDMDYIEDSDNWQSQDWPPEDALHSWGPNPPEDFVHNYEADAP